MNQTMLFFLLISWGFPLWIAASLAALIFGGK